MPRTRVRPLLRLESLEGRDAPATLVTPTRVTYRDVDGDTVSVALSKPLLTAANVNDTFAFDAGGVDGTNATGQQLRRIDLAALGPAAARTAITVTATRGSVTGGDGFAAVGEVSAAGIDLGIVTIDGDLGRIVAGDARVETRGLAGLSVQSLGRYGTTTGAPDLASVVQGGLGFLQVNGDMTEASLETRGQRYGNIGMVRVGGSVVGGATPGSGRIQSGWEIGSLAIGGDLVGGAGFDSGLIHTSARVFGAVTIGGSIRGGAGPGSGRVLTTGDIGRTTVGGDLIGGDGENSGQVSAGAWLVAGLTVRGSVRGGAGRYSGYVTASRSMEPLVIGGDLTGGNGEGSGRVKVGYWVTRMTVGGSVRGGAGIASGLITLSRVDSLTIRGDVRGGSGPSSGGVSALFVPRAAVGGSLVGGAGTHSGRFYVLGVVGALAIDGDVIGGSASGAADLIETGFVHAHRIGALTVGGSLIAGTDDTTGRFFNNGAIRAADDLGTVLVKGSLVGNPTHPAVISARGQPGPVGPVDVAIGRLTVRGGAEYAQILGGVDAYERQVSADAQIGPVVVGGDWVASSLSVGIATGADGVFGTSDDVKHYGTGRLPDDPRRVAKLVGLTIGGQALGTPGSVNSPDHFGIVAEVVGPVTIGGTTVRRKAGPHNDDVAIGITGDLRVREV